MLSFEQYLITLLPASPCRVSSTQANTCPVASTPARAWSEAAAKTTAPTGTLSTTKALGITGAKISWSPCRCRTIGSLGRVAVPPAPSCHRTHSSRSSSVKSRHIKHLLSFKIHRSNPGGVFLFLWAAYQNDRPQFLGFCP